MTSTDSRRGTLRSRKPSTGQEVSGGAHAAIVMRAIHKRFGGTEALAGVNLHLQQGELYGLIGPDGAGKTTLIRTLAGLVVPNSGQVTVFGSDPTRSAIRERLGLMPQQYSLYRDLSVRENLQFFARLNALPRSVFVERSERLLAITRLAPFVDRRAEALSGGMYKKLALACALLHQPELLLLDEPTNGVDPVSRRELWALLYEFVADGMAILVSTPYLDEAERCHRVGLLHRGRLLAEGEPSQLLEAFEDETYEVVGGCRTALDSALDCLSEVYAQSPAGSHLRIVVPRGRSEAVSQRLGPLGAKLARTAPTFEDVYLARLHGEGP